MISHSDASCLYTATGVMQELLDLYTNSVAPAYQQRLSRDTFQGVHVIANIEMRADGAML